MTPREQRRLDRFRAEATAQGMTLPEWQAWRVRTQEQREAAERVKACEREAQHRAEITRARGRLSAGTGTIGDALAVSAHDTFGALAFAWEDRLMKGARPR